MANKLPWKILTGSFLALLALFTIFASTVLAKVTRLEPHLLKVVIGIAALGGLFYLIGRTRARGAERVARQNGQARDSDGSEHPLSFFRRLDFWGGILIVSALPIFFLTQFKQRLKEPPVATVVARQPEVKPAPVEFPPMTLQGMVCNGHRSTVVINGQTLTIGDRYQGVQVVAIKPSGVTLALGESRRVLKLD